MPAISARWLGITALGLIPSVFICASQAAETVPNLSGQWGRDMQFFEPPTSGPGPVVSALRKPDGSMVEQSQCCGIMTSWFGDPANAILKPQAAEAVRNYNASALAGKVAPDLHNRCWPEPPPFVLGLHFGVNIVQKADEVVFVYLLHNTVRHVRLNASHPKVIAPSWPGNSVGRYQNGDLVIDTVGIKSAPISTVDAFGTPHTDALHVVERYHLIDGKSAADAQQKNGAIHLRFQLYGRGVIDPDTTKQGLQVEFTVEDPGVFTAPWSGRVTYRRLIGDWPEAICAENPQFHGADAPIPTARTPDF